MRLAKLMDSELLVVVGVPRIDIDAAVAVHIFEPAGDSVAAFVIHEVL